MSLSSFNTRRHVAANGREESLARVPVPPPGWEFTSRGMSVDGLHAVDGLHVGTVDDRIIVQRLDGNVVMDERRPPGLEITTWFRMRLEQLAVQLEDVVARDLAEDLAQALRTPDPLLPALPDPRLDRERAAFVKNEILEARTRGRSGEFEIALADGNPFRFVLSYRGAPLMTGDFPIEEDGGFRKLLGVIEWRLADLDDVPNPPESMLREWYERTEPLVSQLVWEQVDAMHAEAEAATHDIGLAAKLRPLTVEFERGVPEAKWYLEDLVAEGALTYIGGYIGAGKTPTTLRAVASLLAGRSFLGFSARDLPPGFRVAYLTQEGEPTFLPAAADAELNDPALSDRFHVGYFHDLVADDFGHTVEDAARWLAAGGGGLLVVDTMLDWSKATDENDAATMTAALQPLVVAVQKYKIAAVAIGHSVKNLDDTPDSEADTRHIRGSGAVVSNASVVYLLKKAKPRQDGGVRCLKRVRSRLATTTPELSYTVLEDGRLREVSFFEQAGREEDANARRLLEALREAGGSAAERDLSRDLHLYGADLRNAIDELERTGHVRRAGTGKRGNAKRLEIVT